MNVKEQLHDQTWATSRDYDEVLPYLDNDLYMVHNTFHSNGLFDHYFIGLK